MIEFLYTIAVLIVLSYLCIIIGIGVPCAIIAIYDLIIEPIVRRLYG